MFTSLRTSLIIAAMVTLCLLALPGQAERGDPGASEAAMRLAIPLTQSGHGVELEVGLQSLALTLGEINAYAAVECSAPEPQVTESEPSSFTTALTSGFEMPFFSVAGLLGGAVSK